jgi:hypothetical protein
MLDVVKILLFALTDGVVNLIIRWKTETYKYCCLEILK